MFGNYGRILELDLTTGKGAVRDIPERDYETFTSGSGLGARLLIDDPGITADPLAPEMPLLFLTGLLVGTPAVSACKINVCSRSPLTGIWAESVAGGDFALTMKGTGYDGVLFRGRAPKPVYLWLTEARWELRDAAAVWGQDTYETDRLLREQTDAKARVGCIGPAGENLVKISGIMFEGPTARATGRTGMGAVMGSKNLKAVVCCGKKRPELYDLKGMQAMLKVDIPEIRKYAKALTDWSTAGGVEAVEFWGDLPIKNWRLGSWPAGAKQIAGQSFIPKYLEGHHNCISCCLRCGKHVTLATEGKPQVFGHGPEYETLAGFGANLLNADPRVIIEANNLCNRLGLDTISTSAVIAFAMEAWEKGVLTARDTGGLKLEWGNGEATVELVRRIGRREGLGDLLAEGVRLAAAKLGRGTAAYAVHTKGLEYPYHDPRAFTSMATNYATASRGACHLEALTYFLSRGTPLADLGYLAPPNPHNAENDGKICYDAQNYQSLFNPLGLCKFIFLGRVGPTVIAKWINAVTGWGFDLNRLMLTGERLVNLKRLFNVRFGISAKDDVLPPRLLEPRPDGKAGGVIPDLARSRKQLYELRGWDENGIPTKEKLAALGLEAWSR